MSDQEDMLATIAAVGGDPADLPFWSGCQEGQFLIHQCSMCGRSYWPASRCIEHGDCTMQWVEASGRGTLHTYTVMHHAYTAEMREKVPYFVAVVRLAEGPFFHSNLIDCPIDKVAIGMELVATMSPHPNGLTLPVFRPATSLS